VTVLADTGVLVSAADVREPRHRDCAEVLRDHHGETIMTAPALAETSWMIESRLGPGAEARFLRLVTAGEIEVVDLMRDDYLRCTELIETYDDLGLGLVDASIVAVAERLGITTIATLNRRDFAVVRPSHVAAFELVP
jgi:predicted nucleic acid-binding protein